MALDTVTAKDANSVKQEFIVAQDGSGSLASASVAVNTSGAAITGHGALDIATGLVPGVTDVHKFGFNSTVPNGTFADIWTYGPTDNSYNWPTTTEKFRIKAGGNVNDAAAGSGAQNIVLEFLDATGVETVETLATAGSSASATTTVTGRRINRAYVSGVGTQFAANTGIILIENESTGAVVASIDEEMGQTQTSMYTVPLGYTAYITRAEVEVAIGTNKDADVRLWQREGAYETTAPFSSKRLVHQWEAIQGDASFRLVSYRPIPALTDIWMEAKGNGATTSVDVNYDLFLVPSS